MFFTSPRQNHNFNFLLKGIAKPKEIKKKKKTAEGRVCEENKSRRKREQRPRNFFYF